MTFNEVRGDTIRKREQMIYCFLNNGSSRTLRNGCPETVVRKSVQLLKLQIEYLNTVGNHGATFTDVLKKQCLRKTDSREVEYNFGKKPA